LDVIIPLFALISPEAVIEPLVANAPVDPVIEKLFAVISCS
jgi:hypothetical protein